MEPGLQFMTKNMMKAHRHYIETKKASYRNEPMFGKTITIYLPAHSDLNCPCRKCVIYRLSEGTQPIITINLPAIKLNT